MKSFKRWAVGMGLGAVLLGSLVMSGCGGKAQDTVAVSTAQDITTAYSGDSSSADYGWGTEQFIDAEGSSKESGEGAAGAAKLSAVDSSMTVDQDNDDEISGWSFGCGRPPMGLGSMFQSFTPSASTLSTVALRLRAGGGYPASGYTTTIKIREASVDGNILGTSSTFVPASQAVGSQTLVYYHFSPARSLTPGKLYLIEWVSPEGGGYVFTWMGTPYDSYPGGVFYGCFGVPIMEKDFNFITYTADVQKPAIFASAGVDQKVLVGETVLFNGSGSTPQEEIVSYDWQFGEGAAGSGVKVSHVYAQPGFYTVTLTVMGRSAGSASDTLTVTVLSPQQAIQDMHDVLQSFGLEKGIFNSLSTKLTGTIDALNRSNDHAARGKLLCAFVNHTRALSGKKHLTALQAGQLMERTLFIARYFDVKGLPGCKCKASLEL